MLIKYHKKFIKSFNRLSPKHQELVSEKIETFKKNPREQSLKNHVLKGRMIGLNSFSVTGDIRIIFEEYKDYTFVLILDVGKHTQVY